MAIEVKGVTNDPWVLSPTSSSIKKNPDSKPLAGILSLNSRASNDTISSVSPLSQSLMFATPSPTAKSKESHRSLWTAMKQFLTCFNPVRSSNSKIKKNSVAASKAGSTHSVRASPSPDHAYSSMNAEERDENLKAVITYCNKSMKSGRIKDHRG